MTVTAHSKPSPAPETDATARVRDSRGAEMERLPALPGDWSEAEDAAVDWAEETAEPVLLEVIGRCGRVIHREWVEPERDGDGCDAEADHLWADYARDEIAAVRGQ